jgi:hypothetical protein
VNILKGSYGEKQLQAALRAISRGDSIRGASMKYTVPRRTLQCHWKEEVKKPGQQHLGQRGIFSPELEEQLVTKLIDLQRLFYGVTIADLQKWAYQMAEKLQHSFNHLTQMAGRGWIRGFLDRHPSLALRSPEPTSMSRATGFNKLQVDTFLGCVASVLQDSEASPSEIYNMDESGITTVHKPQRIIGQKGQKQIGKVTSGERGQTVTIICCMNAAGTYIPPFMIFPRKRMNMTLLNDTPPGTVGVVSASGWTTSEIFLQWLQHFIDYAKPTEQKKVVLLLHGHSSHKSLQAIELARQNNVMIVCFSPHTSHRLQPLDVSFFGPLKSAYSAECDKWMIQHPGKRITFYQMGKIFGLAYVRVALMAKALSGFQASGICPYNPDIFTDEDFAPAQLTEENDPDENNNNFAVTDGE